MFIRVTVILGTLAAAAATPEPEQGAGSLLQITQKQKQLKTQMCLSTYNTGLIVSPLVNQVLAAADPEGRKDKIVDYLRNSNSDVVCLQEVLSVPMVNDIVAGLSGNFPHSMSFADEHSDDAGAACLPAQGMLLQQCGMEVAMHPHMGPALAMDPATVIGFCLQTKQAARATLLGSRCLHCMAKAPTIPECYHPVLGSRYQFNPGVVLLSKEPLMEKQYEKFDSYITSGDRGFLSATVGGKRVLCTHLTAPDLKYVNLPMPPLPDKTIDGTVVSAGTSTTQANEQKYQINLLMAATKNSPNAVLLGDTNTGPPPTPYSENFEILAGEYNVPDQLFTWDPSANILAIAQGYPADGKEYLDQILAKTAVGEVSMFQPKNADGRDLSDHYGLTACVE